MRRMSYERLTPIHSFVSFLAEFFCFRHVDTALDLTKYTLSRIQLVVAPRNNELGPRIHIAQHRAEKANVRAHYIAMNQTTPCFSSSHSELNPIRVELRPLFPYLPRQTLQSQCVLEIRGASESSFSSLL